ncbi:hypothetical protein ACA910_010040 [Epithemia clementina (nom. ined.)]
MNTTETKDSALAITTTTTTTTTPWKNPNDPTSVAFRIRPKAKNGNLPKLRSPPRTDTSSRSVVSSSIPKEEEEKKDNHHHHHHLQSPTTPLRSRFFEKETNGNLAAPLGETSWAVVPPNLIRAAAPPPPGETNHSIPHILIFTHKTNLLDPQTADPAASSRYLANVVNTIQMYHQAWSTTTTTTTTTTTMTSHSKNNNRTENGTTATPLQQQPQQQPQQQSAIQALWFLDNAECRQVLQQVDPRLVPYFDDEPRGDYQADLCRAAALYVTGGYYFDVDLRALSPATSTWPSNVTFATVLMLEGPINAFFQAFWATSPGNPIVYDSLAILWHYYYHHTQQQQPPPPPPNQDRPLQPPESSERDFDDHSNILTDAATATALNDMKELGLLGPIALKAAYDYHMTRRSRRDSNKHSAKDSNVLLATEQEQEQEVVLLAEELVTRPEQRRRFSPFLGLDQYQDHGVGCCCNFLVHNGRQPFFFSRIVGSGHFCERWDNDNNHNNNKTKDATDWTTTATRAQLVSLWDQIPKEIPRIRFQDLVVLLK